MRCGTTWLISWAGIENAIPAKTPGGLMMAVLMPINRPALIVRPRLGMQMAPEQPAQQIGVDEGALIIKGQPDSPAAKAGLRGTGRDEEGHIQLGDVIVAVDGKPIKNMKDFYTSLEHYHAGDSVTLTIFHVGE